MNWSYYLTTCQLPEKFCTKCDGFFPKDCRKICKWEKNQGKGKRGEIESNLLQIERLLSTEVHWGMKFWSMRLTTLGIGCNGWLMRSPEWKDSNPPWNSQSTWRWMVGQWSVLVFGCFGLFSGRVSRIQKSSSIRCDTVFSVWLRGLCKPVPGSRNGYGDHKHPLFAGV